jgi:hypothetical protein
MFIIILKYLAVKMPGNYLLVAYRENDERYLLLSKRFMIYANDVALAMDGQNQGLGTLSVSNQQLNFKLNYSKLDVVNPMESIQIWVRKTNDGIMRGVVLSQLSFAKTDANWNTGSLIKPISLWPVTNFGLWTFAHSTFRVAIPAG